MPNTPILPPFLAQFIPWAAARPDIQALALAGSHARGAARPDSDVDLILLCDEPTRYVQDTTWVGLFRHTRAPAGEKTMAA